MGSFYFVLLLMSTVRVSEGFLVRGLGQNMWDDDNLDTPESDPVSSSTASSSTTASTSSATTFSTTFSTSLMDNTHAVTADIRGSIMSNWTENSDIDTPRSNPVSSSTDSAPTSTSTSSISITFPTSLMDDTHTLNVTAGKYGSIISNWTEAPSGYLNQNAAYVKISNMTVDTKRKNGKYHAKRLNIFGNQSFINANYKYIYPIVLGICLGTTFLFILVLGIQYRQGTRMGRSTLVILIAIATADTLTMVSSLAEISYLYKTKGENYGFLPFSSCKLMYVLERLSAVPHAISVWLTVVLSCQRWLCVAMPLTTRRFVNIRCSVISVIVTIVTVTVFHVYRFFDRIFIKVTILTDSLSDKPIETCRSSHAEWVKDTKFYELFFMWGRIAVANVLPSFLMVAFVTLMVRGLLKTDRFLLQANKDNVKTRTDRRRLSAIVIIIALIVVGVELSTGVLMSLYALKFSTKLFIFSVETFQSIAFVYDIVLYVSYFVIFLIYCLMSKGIREKVTSIFVRCWSRGQRAESATASSLVSR